MGAHFREVTVIVRCDGFGQGQQFGFGIDRTESGVGHGIKFDGLARRRLGQGECRLFGSKLRGGEIALYDNVTPAVKGQYRDGG